MADGKIQNVGNAVHPFSISESGQQGSDSIMGMRGSSAKDRLKPTVQVQVPASSGSGAGVQNVGQLDPGAKPIK